MESLSGVSLGTIETVQHHPNADRLDIVQVYGCPAIVGRDEFQAGDKVVFIPFDQVIPADAEYLPEKLRGRKVKPAKLRGTFSMALCVKNTWGFTDADDIGEKLNIRKWEPGIEQTNSFDEATPPRGVVISKYDLRSLRQYREVLQLGEEVVITEKLHGCNARYVYQDGQLHVGSRSHWLKRENSTHWGVAAEQSGLEDKLRDIPGVVVFGEVYGQVQGGFNYSVPRGEFRFAAFDMFDSTSNRFFDHDLFSINCSSLDIPTVPRIYRGNWLGFDHHASMAEGQSLLGGNIREGFVVKPFYERDDDRFNRVALKLHGQGYLCRKEK